MLLTLSPEQVPRKLSFAVIAIAQFLGLQAVLAEETKGPSAQAVSQGGTSLEATVLLPTDSLAYFVSGKNLTSEAEDQNVPAKGTTRASVLKRLVSRIGHEGKVNAICVSPDGKMLASGGDDNLVVLWSVPDGKKIRELPTCDRPVNSLVFSPDRALLAYSTDRIFLWDLKANKVISEIMEPEGSLVLDLAFSPNGKLLASTGFGHVDLWETPKGNHLKQFGWVMGMGIVPSVSFSVDGKMLLTGNFTIDFPPAPSKIRVWTTDDGKLHRTWEAPFQKVVSVRFSPDGDLFAALGGDLLKVPLETLSYWSLTTGREKGRITDVLAFAFSLDGRSLATANEKGITIWEVLTGKQRCSWEVPGHTITRLAFSPDSHLLVSSATDRTVFIWDASGSHKEQEINQRDRDLRVLWDRLGAEDAETAYGIICMLANSPRQALPLLKENLRPVQSPNRADIEKLILDLDNNSFAIRKTASQELEKLGDLAKPALLKALKSGQITLESQRSLERLLSRLDSSLNPNELRVLRAMEILERIGGAHARTLLTELAGGDPQARVSREAIKALKRLN